MSGDGDDTPPAASPAQEDGLLLDNLSIPSTILGSGASTTEILSLGLTIEKLHRRVESLEMSLGGLIRTRPTSDNALAGTQSGAVTPIPPPQDGETAQSTARPAGDNPQTTSVPTSSALGAPSVPFGLRQRRKSEEKGLDATSADPEVERPAVLQQARPANSSHMGTGLSSGGTGGIDSRRRRSSILKLKNYIWLEIFGAQEYYEKEEVTSKADIVLHNFLHVPVKLEECLTFGHAICIDSFLYAFTFLPLRVLLSAVLAFTSFVYPRTEQRFHRNNAYDLMRGIILLTACFVLQSFQISRVYHYIRGQATIKLYVLTAMFEILDKLLISFGQDTLDSLYWSAKKSIRKRHLLVNFLVALAYVIIHSFLLFVHVVTLFVAVNSSDQALLTLLISNNFAEMKTSVFKRFETKHLFQLTCADMVERFKLSLFLLLIAILNFAQQAGGEQSSVTLAWDMGMVVVMIFLGELVADSVKHAFITKFNEIDAGAYQKYTEDLAMEITLYRKNKKLMLDHTHVVTKKIGLAQLPLAALAARLMVIAWNAGKFDASYLGLSFLLSMIFVILVALKILIGIGLLQWAIMILHKRTPPREEGAAVQAAAKEVKS